MSRVYFAMHTLFRGSLRPLVTCTILLALAAFQLSQAHAFSAAKAEDAYARAVAEYVKAAETEVGTFAKEVKNREQVKKAGDLSEVKRTLDTCRTLVERLRASTPATFDNIKKEYELRRAELTAQLAAQPAASPPAS